jgi:hypothetical protein
VHARIVSDGGRERADLAAPWHRFVGPSLSRSKFPPHTKVEGCYFQQPVICADAQASTCAGACSVPRGTWALTESCAVRDLVFPGGEHPHFGVSFDARSIDLRGVRFRAGSCSAAAPQPRGFACGFLMLSGISFRCGSLALGARDEGWASPNKVGSRNPTRTGPKRPTPPQPLVTPINHLPNPSSALVRILNFRRRGHDLTVESSARSSSKVGARLYRRGVLSNGPWPLVRIRSGVWSYCSPLPRHWKFPQMFSGSIRCRPVSSPKKCLVGYINWVAQRSGIYEKETTRGARPWIDEAEIPRQNTFLLTG